MCILLLSCDRLKCKIKFKCISWVGYSQSVDVKGSNVFDGNHDLLWKTDPHTVHNMYIIINDFQKLEA